MTAAKKTKGRPAYEPDAKTREQVKAIGAMGHSAEDIGKVIGLSAPTIRKYYMHELEVGQIEALAMVAQSLHKQALKGHVTACIFILKCKGGWKEDGDGLGKKELQELLAKVAQKGTDWDKLLTP